MRLPVLGLVVFSAFFWQSVAAQNAAPGAYGTGSPGTTGSPSVGSIIIGTVERRILQDYFQRQLDLYQNQAVIQTSEPVVQNKGKAEKNGKKQGQKRKKGKQVPPGLAKKGGLPPGILKQLQPNQSLPTGVNYRQLPREVLVQLPTPQPGTRYLLADDRVLLVQSATNVILDTLQVAAANLLQ